jgi:cytochrome d ubiquinol oxidase subunit II
MVWAGLLAVAVFMYVLLDGFDLGVGILFPFAETDEDRDVMMNSVAPVWDGNETWLVLGGGGLFAAFPKAYAALMPAVYMPIGFMLIALIFRGVAFEFRFKAHGSGRRIWDQAFHWGSVVATFSQGLVLGALVQGITLEDGRFAGGMFDWLTPFSFVTGCALVWGYTLLGSGWLVIKTEGRLEAWCRRAGIVAAVITLGPALSRRGLVPPAAAHAHPHPGRHCLLAPAGRPEGKRSLRALPVDGCALPPGLCGPARRHLPLSRSLRSCDP